MSTVPGWQADNEAYPQFPVTWHRRNQQESTTMKSTFKLFALVLMAGLLFTACSKEKKITRQIEGTWVINQYIQQQGSTTETIENAGNISFNEDGSGNITFTQGNNDVVIFTWTNTDTEITTTDEDNEVAVWEIIESGKSKFEIKTTNESVSASLTMKLIK